jgi:hypothetical protein
MIMGISGVLGHWILIFNLSEHSFIFENALLITL